MGQDIGINEQRGRRRNATIQRREWHRGSVADSLATGSCPGHGLLAARDRGARSCPCSARSGGRAEAKARLIRIENLFGAVRVPLSKSAALDEVCITCARYGASRRWGCQCSLTLDSTVQTISATIRSDLFYRVCALHVVSPRDRSGVVRAASLLAARLVGGGAPRDSN